MSPTRRSTNPDARSLAQAAECLRTLAHPVRLRIVQLLLEGQYTVGELAVACDISSPVASGHLGIMRDRGLLGQERRGPRTYYHVRQRALAGIMDCIKRSFGEHQEAG